MELSGSLEELHVVIPVLDSAIGDHSDDYEDCEQCHGILKTDRATKEPAQGGHQQLRDI